MTEQQAMRMALEVLELVLDISEKPKNEINEAITALRQAIAEAEKQEPVAWGVFEGNLHDMFFTQEEANEMAHLKGAHAEVKPLYTRPQPAAWVGLTDEEIKNACDKHTNWFAIALDLEVKLKEKNT